MLNPRRDIFYLGIRSYEEGEARFIVKHNIPILTTEYCHSTPIKDVIDEIYQHFNDPERKLPLWISFDIDGLDEAEFRSTGTPEPKGLSWKFTRDLLKELLPHSVGMDLTEVNFDRTDGE